MKWTIGYSYSLVLAALVLAITVSVFSGPTDLLGVSDVIGWLSGDESERLDKAWLVFWELRLPRVLLAVGVGSALAISGVLLQSFFKNPLAEPYILGVSSGAGFGAVVWSFFVTGWVGVTNGSMIVAFVGAVLAVVLVLFISRNRGVVLNHKLLLAGVAINVFFASLTTGLLLNAQTDQFRALLHWLMGSVAHKGWWEVQVLMPIVLGVGLVSLRYWKSLDWISLDENSAFTAGVFVNRVRWVILVLATVLASTSVAICGSIAFVGLMVPHAVRYFSGASHRHLIPLSGIGGSLLVLVSDYLGKNISP
ncbi:MAG: iron ABC transporter permease, partial [Verrucomicrobiota bacterium]